MTRKQASVLTDIFDAIFSRLDVLEARLCRAEADIGLKKPGRAVKLSDEAVKAIRESKESCSALARRYSISQPYASLIKRGLARRTPLAMPLPEAPGGLTDAQSPL